MTVEIRPECVGFDSGISRGGRGSKSYGKTDAVEVERM